MGGSYTVNTINSYFITEMYTKAGLHFITRLYYLLLEIVIIRHHDGSQTQFYTVLNGPDIHAVWRITGLIVAVSLMYSEAI